MSDYRVSAGEAQEDQFTAAIEKYTAPIPSSVYLGLAMASIIASITIQSVQKEKANPALYVGQWVAPFLLLAIYNKMVKQHGSAPTGVNVCWPSSTTLTAPVPML
jgi:hypothetical protein